MRIEITVTRLGPLAGSVCARSSDERDDGAGFPFSGWLELLGILERVIGGQGDPDRGRYDRPQ